MFLDSITRLTRAHNSLAPAGSKLYNGEIVAKDRTTVVSESSGMALSVDVEVGDAVMAGDQLVQDAQPVAHAALGQGNDQTQAVGRELELDPAIVNPLGGAVALGALLTSAEAVDPLAKIPEFKVSAVNVEKLSA